MEQPFLILSSDERLNNTSFKQNLSLIVSKCQYIFPKPFHSESAFIQSDTLELDIKIKIV